MNPTLLLFLNYPFIIFILLPFTGNHVKLRNKIHCVFVIILFVLVNILLPAILEKSKGVV